VRPLRPTTAIQSALAEHDLRAAFRDHDHSRLAYSAAGSRQ